MYCITNSIHSVYSTDIYKLGNTINMIDIIRSYNISYFEKINIHLLLEVQFKFMFETMLFIKLNEYRVKRILYKLQNDRNRICKNQRTN